MIWPNVSEWVPLTRAVEQFVDQELLRKYIVAQNAAEDARHELQTQMLAADSSGAHAALMGAKNANPAWDTASNKKYKAEVEERNACARLFDDLNRQLRSGALAARGVLHEEKKLPDEWKYFQPPNWVSLTFDLTEIGTVRGGGSVFKDVEIGKHEASK